VRLAQGFRVPTLYDRYGASAQRLIIRDLRPERVTLDAEFGTRLTTSALSAQAAVFQRLTHDAIVWFPGNFAWSPQNVPRERARGAEGRAAATVGPFELGAWAGTYVTRLDVGPLTMPTPYVPYAAGGGSAVARIASSTVAATLRATGRRPFTGAPAAPDDELPGALLIDLHFSRHVALARQRALISLGADNLGGRQWEPVRGYPAPGRAWSVSLTLDP
jgi:outer membrane cobalamin receptor